ncbi:MAG: hypothetical protein WBP82_10855 [Leuconostoc mesenteroides]
MGALYYLNCIDCHTESEGVSGSTADSILQELWENRYVLVAASRATFIGISIDGSQYEPLLRFLEEHLEHKAKITNSYKDEFPDINLKKLIVIEDRRKNISKE